MSLSKWQEASLGQYVKVQGGFAFKSVDFCSLGVPVIKIKNVRSRYIDVLGADCVNAAVAESARDYLLNDGDILISMTGSGPNAPNSVVGRVARYVGKSQCILINQRVGRLVPKDAAKLDKRFLFFLLSQNEVQDWLVSNSTGSANQANISNAQIECLRFLFPPIEDQRAIAGVLGALDDKIELNRRMNATLEAMARALFKSWFVNFDPVRAKMEGKQPFGMDAATAALFPSRLTPSPLGDISDGWNASNVGSEFDITMGQSPPGETYNEAGEGLPFYQGRTDFGFRYPTRRIFCTQPNRIAEAGDALISVRAPVGDINMAFEKCILGRGVGALRHKSKARSYTYYAIHSIQSDLKAFEADGTVFGSINKQDVEKLSIIKPNPAIIDRFEKIVADMDEKILSNTKEILELERMRDYLLPKLISGDIRIPNAEKLVEAV